MLGFLLKGRKREREREREGNKERRREEGDLAWYLKILTFHQGTLQT
jgi:hypothetical protein